MNRLSQEILFTANTNLEMGTCNGQNDGEMRFYIDGALQQTFGFGRCWGQHSALTTAFVLPMSYGQHTMELRWCVNLANTPKILGSYPTILTATALASSPYYEARSSSILPMGGTSLAVSAPFTAINNAGQPMQTSHTAGSDVLLWQGLSLGGLKGNGTNLRFDPLTGEDWTMFDDGAVGVGLYTYTTLAAGASTTVTAHYSSAGGNNIVTKSAYDNVLNTIAFRTPPAGKFGKTVVTGPVNEAVGTITNLAMVPITASAEARYLITFSANYAYSSAAGGGCDFLLYVDGVERTRAYLSSSNVTQTLESSIITIESIAAGTDIPVQIRFRRTIGGTCTVQRATLAVIALE